MVGGQAEEPEEELSQKPNVLTCLPLDKEVLQISEVQEGGAGGRRRLPAGGLHHPRKRLAQGTEGTRQGVIACAMLMITERTLFRPYFCCALR